MPKQKRARKQNLCGISVYIVKNSKHGNYFNIQIRFCVGELDSLFFYNYILFVKMLTKVLFIAEKNYLIHFHKPW